MKSYRAIPFWILAATAPVSANAQDLEATPWLKPRSLENFKALLDRSPFSLPTAEETIAAEDRYFLTGAATINEKPVVFVFDKNTQARLMLEKAEGPDAQGQNRLIELSQSPDPKNLSAKIQIDGKVTEIRFAEGSFDAPAAQGQPSFAGQPGFGQPGQPQTVAQPGQPGQFGQPSQPGQPVQPPAPMPPGMPPAPPQNNTAIQPGGDNSQPPRRVIRRRVISNQPPTQPVPGQ